MKRVHIFAALLVLTNFCVTTPLLAQETGKDVFMAVQSQDLPALQNLLSHGAKLNYRENGRPLLGWAAQNGNVKIVEALLKAGANPNEFDEHPGHTPLMRAIETQQLAVVRALLQAKADPNAKSKDGKSCLMLAVETEKPEFVQALVEGGADVKVTSSDGGSPALLAAESGSEASLKIIEILAKAHADLNASDDMHTPLTYAIEQSNKKLAQGLLDVGADPNAPTRSGKLPIELALDNKEMLPLLLKAKANPNVKFKDGSTPLITVIQSGNAEVVKLLLDAKADPAFAAADGTLPSLIGSKSSNEAIAALFPTIDPSSRGVTPPVQAIKSVESNGTTCTIVDAAKRLMEVHALLQAQVNAGKMSSDIFRTYNEDTKEFGQLEVENPAEACRLLDRLRAKYGV